MYHKRLILPISLTGVFQHPVNKALMISMLCGGVVGGFLLQVNNSYTTSVLVAIMTTTVLFLRLFLFGRKRESLRESLFNDVQNGLSKLPNDVAICNIFVTGVFLFGYIVKGKPILLVGLILSGLASIYSMIRRL